jgi:hypothetical protein
MSDEEVPAVTLTLRTPQYTSTFAMEGREMIEAMHEPDGTIDWENAAICDPRGDSPELQAAVREALRIGAERYS